MRRNLFYVLIAMIAVGVILLNTNDTVKYLICEEPSNYEVVVTSVTDEEVTVSISALSDNETYSGYKYHIKGSTLYIGITFTMNPLNEEADGDSIITIELEESIETIILKGPSSEVTVYPTNTQD